MRTLWNDRGGRAAACLFAGTALAAAAASGCADEAPHQSPADRALADPWNYGPKTPGPDRGIRRPEASPPGTPLPPNGRSSNAPTSPDGPASPGNSVGGRGP